MAITAAQIEEIRLISGDDISGDYVVSDAIITVWYSETSSICATAYRVARARLAKASKTVGSGGEGAQVTNPKVNQIAQLVSQLKADCPSASAAVVGSLSLGIDEETNEVDIE